MSKPRNTRKPDAAVPDLFEELDPEPRLLMGPGPINVYPRVLRAMSVPLQGQFDPQFTQHMAQTMSLWRRVFRTVNEWTFMIDGSARRRHRSMFGVDDRRPATKCWCQSLAALDICSGLRLQVARVGTVVEAIETEWGTVFESNAFEDAVKQHQPKVVAICQGDTSTTMLQPLAELGAICRRHDALLYVDCTASLVGNPFETDAWQIDARPAGLQKCLSGPPGIAPVTFNARVEEVLKHRKHVEQGIRMPEVVEGNGPIIRSNYFDLAMLMDYWSPRRLNHHTEAASMLYAARECARVVLGEGLEAASHGIGHASGALRAGLEAMGLDCSAMPSTAWPTSRACDHPQGNCRRRQGAARDARRLRHRDRHLVRAAARQDLAYRHHGLRVPEGQRAAVPGFAGGSSAAQWLEGAAGCGGRCGLQSVRGRLSDRRRRR